MYLLVMAKSTTPSINEASSLVISKGIYSTDSISSAIDKVAGELSASRTEAVNRPVWST